MKAWKHFNFTAIIVMAGIIAAFSACKDPGSGGGGGGAPTPGYVSVTGITLNTNILSLSIGNSATLTATITPSDATNKNITWSSNYNRVATVNNGIVTAVALGDPVIITATTQDGNKSASCTIIVTIGGNAQTPIITSHPVGTTVNVGDSHTLSVAANAPDGGALTYQWYSNTSLSNSGGTPINGATSTSYNPPTDTEGTYFYFVEVKNTIFVFDGGTKTATARSIPVTFTVNTLENAKTPEIISQPEDATVIFNANHSLSVTASVTGGGTLTYQWYSNTSNSNDGGTEIPGATSYSYNPPTGTEGTYYYYVEVTNTITDNGDGGNKTATAMSYAVTLTVYPQVNVQAPVITTHPANATVNVGASPTLSVVASVSAGEMLSFQWYSNTVAANTGGTPIDGEIYVYYDPPTDTAGTYYYFVEVKNTINDNGDGGVKTASIRSNVATLMVNTQTQVHAQTPTINTQPVGGTVNVGDSHTLSVAASVTDSGTLSYLWYSNTSASNSGGTTTGVTTYYYNPPTGTADTYYYYVVVTNTITNNGDGGNKTASVPSNPVTLTVNAPKINAQTPTITTQPAGGTVIFNGTHTLSVTASVSDGGALTYQWYSNTTASTTGGSETSGETSVTYNPPTGTAGTYYYYVIVTNTINNNGDGGNKTATATSNLVTLIVNAQVNAQAPDITIQPAGATVNVGETHTLSVTATGGGALSYQWYSNTSVSISGGSEISGATSDSYDPSTDTEGEYYYFVVVTNTITDNGDGGNKTATATSDVVTLTVEETEP